MGAILDETKRNLTLYLVIHPLLFIVGGIDLIKGLLFPDPKDESLPERDAALSIQIDENEAVYRSALVDDVTKVEDQNTNLYKELKSIVNNYYNRKTMGVREIFSIDDEVQPNGKIFKKYSLGDYKWSTYEEVFERINNISNGLLKLGLKSNQNVVLFSETRPEWLISAYSCFRIKAPIVTLYATLGVDSLPFGINQTQANFLITSADQIPKIQKILDKIPNVTNIIVFSDKLNIKNIDEFKKSIEANNYKIKVTTIDEVEDLGKNSETIEEFEVPKRDDLAIIMYTSGSTGNPKGVMISHGNLILSCRSLRTRMGKCTEKDILISYLPLAHVMELCCEITCLTNGIAIGYSSAQTLGDTSTGIKSGQLGDLRTLNPTLFAGVPIVFERLSKAVNEKISSTGWITQTLFKLAFSKKLRRLQRGSSSYLLDKLIFKKIRSAVLGENIRIIMAGGALLSKKVHEFSLVCFGTTYQAYGLTETCAAGSSTLPNQTITGSVGGMLPSVQLKLVNWDEGEYRITDKPNPRGEILIGGDNVSMGYYNMPEKTAEDFIYINGVKYFATGDIGEMLPNGYLRIIDRKKDLVKLSGGEYVSLNKVESLTKLMPLVDNICMIANPIKSYCVALICPNLNCMKEIFKQELPNANIDMDEKNIDKLLANICSILDKNENVVEKLTNQIKEHCKNQNLFTFEIPDKIKFVKEIWLPDTGLVTDSLKIKRKEIEKFYAKEINVLYQ